MKPRVGLVALLVVFSVLGLTLRTSEAGDHASPGRDVVLYELNEQAHRVAVYKKDSGDLVSVRADERALGDPTVRLEITFIED